MVGNATNPVIPRLYEGSMLNDQRPSMGGVVVTPHRERLSSILLDTLSSKMLDKITPDGATKNAK